MKIIAKLALILVPVAVATAACGTHHAHHLAQKITCGTQVASWYEKGGKAQFKALNSAVQASGQADVALAKNHGRSVTPVVKATSELSKAITALASDPVPGCVPGAGADVSAALRDFTRATAAQNQLVRAVKAKNPVAAQKAGQAVGVAFKAGGMKFLAAAAALKTYAVG